MSNYVELTYILNCLYCLCISYGFSASEKKRLEEIDKLLAMHMSYRGVASMEDVLKYGNDELTHLPDLVPVSSNSSNVNNNSEDNNKNNSKKKPSYLQEQVT